LFYTTQDSKEAYAELLCQWIKTMVTLSPEVTLKEFKKVLYVS
jgi:hypothetical protein